MVLTRPTSMGLYLHSVHISASNAHCTNAPSACRLCLYIKDRRASQHDLGEQLLVCVVAVELPGPDQLHAEDLLAALRRALLGRDDRPGLDARSNPPQQSVGYTACTGLGRGAMSSFGHN